MNSEKHFKRNKAGLKGWLGGGKYGAERYAYALHRLSGLGILAYFILHIFVTGSRIGGAQAWDKAMATFSPGIFKFGEFLVFLAFAYHGLNGLRLVFTELGMMMGRPQRPIFPYVNAVRRQRPFFIAVMIVAAIIMLFGGANFYIIGH